MNFQKDASGETWDVNAQKLRTYVESSYSALDSDVSTIAKELTGKALEIYTF